MHPIFIAIGSVHIYSFSVFLVLSWFVCSFVFWKMLRSDGIDEDKIFDLTFYATLNAAILSRLTFVVTHWDLFRDTMLKIAAFWVQPGLSLYGAVLGGLGTLLILSKFQKVRLGYIVDAFAFAFLGAFLVGSIGVLMDGSVAGTITTLPWGIRYVGMEGIRHPVQLYELIAGIGIMTITLFIKRKCDQDKRPYGVTGIWFFFIYCLVMFPLELLKDSHVYLGTLRVNQWILIAFFAESLGALYVRGGGRESIRPAINKTVHHITHTIQKLFRKE